MVDEELRKQNYDYLITPEGKRIELNVEVDEREEGE